MQRRLLFFINPVSGARSKLSLENKIIARCEKENAWFRILFTSAEGDYYFLPDKICEDRVSDVVICGGDGSVAPIVSALLNTTVRVGIVPLGSGNGLARTAGIPYNVDKALRILFTGKGRRVDAFFVNGRLGCQITGLGFDAFIAQEFARKRKRGLSTYTKLAVQHFFGAKAYRFTVTFEDATQRLEAFIVCISNANQFGNNLKIAPRASLTDGLLDVVVLKKTTKAAILASFVNHLLFARKSNPHTGENAKNIIYFNAAKLAVINHDLAPIHVDGDPVEAVERLQIEVLPSAYELIYPF